MTGQCRTTLDQLTGSGRQKGSGQSKSGEYLAGFILFAGQGQNGSINGAIKYQEEKQAISELRLWQSPCIDLQPKLFNCRSQIVIIGVLKTCFLS